MDPDPVATFGEFLRSIGFQKVLPFPGKQPNNMWQHEPAKLQVEVSTWTTWDDRFIFDFSLFVNGKLELRAEYDALTSHFLISDDAFDEPEAYDYSQLEAQIKSYII
jgi:hypothetical protein